ncbi:serine hydrolase domain-containing protein [Flavobacterium sp. RSB2_4_14]|uniref:serine hydrolase domain-containing protein n=1 Tax=Flavobacterium sp. RSB2_4_14 TaxID=3447665 RepID=UPI003F4145EB
MLKNSLLSFFFSLFVTVSFAQKLDTTKLDTLFYLLQTNDKFMGSIAISENGKLLYSRSIGKDDLEFGKKSDSNTKYRIGSISKMFTASLIFKAIEEKKLTLNQTLDAYFPSVPNAKKITIGNMLNHRSGIHNFTNDNSYMSYNTLPKNQAEMVIIISKSKSDFEPNSKMEYSNSNYVLLSYILEKIYKKPFAELLKTKIVTPLGLKNTYFGGKINLKFNECYSYNFVEHWEKSTETDTSIPMGAGGIVSNPIDLNIFIEALFAGKIVSAKSLEQMKTLEDNMGMGMFQMPFYDMKGYGHTGGIDGFSSVLAYMPDNKLSIALTSNGGVYQNNDIMIAALSAYYGKPFVMPTFTKYEVKAEDVKKYLGKYTSDQLVMTLTITGQEDKLYAQATGQSTFPLTATEKDTFEFATAGIKIIFNLTDKVLELNQGGQKFIFRKE